MNRVILRLNLMLLLLFTINVGYSQKLNETFDTAIPNGWQVIDGDNDGNKIHWEHNKKEGGRVDYAGGNKFANDFLISPKVSVTESDKTLTFSHYTKDYDYDYNTLKVYVVEDIPADNNYSKTSTVFDDYMGGNDDWETTTIQLDNYIGKNVYIVFNIINDWGNTIESYCGIDDVTGPELYSEAKPNIEIESETFNDIFENETTTANVTVTNTGSVDLVVTDLSIDIPFSVKEEDKSFTLSKGNSKTIEVTFKPTAVGDYIKALTLSVDGTFDGTNTINLIASCLASKSKINLSITEFAPAVVNGESKATLTVNNLGNANLQITDVSVADPFSIKQEDKIFTVEIGKSKEIEVKFAPINSGNYTKTITLTVSGNYEGSNTIDATAKTYIPDLLIEDFESGEFPPLGWTIKNHGSTYHSWELTKAGSSVYKGKYSAYAGTDGGILITPKLKIKSGDVLTFYAFHSESKKGPLTIKYSSDNKIWNDLKEIDLTGDYKKITVDLTKAVGNYYIGFDAHNYVYIDNISGPELLLSSEPTPATNPKPENSAKGQNNILELSWNKVLGADGYKISMGTENNPTSLYNNKDLGDVSEIKIYGLQFGTKYKWKIVPYNNGVDAINCPTWEFTTMADPTITKFPFFAGFEENEGTAGWVINDWYSGGSPHSGKMSARTTAENKLSILMTPPINLPDNYNIYFYWKNADIPAPLKIAKHDTTFFEVSKDFGQTWTVLRYLSPKKLMKEYKREIVNLSEYAGNNVYLRWRYVSDGDIHKAYGVALDDINIKARPTNPIAEINLYEWSADTVNFNNAKFSGDIFELTNIGVGTLTINSATFSNERFSTDLKNQEIALKEGEKVSFGFTYKADEAGKHETDFVIKCSDNKEFTIKLKGKTYPEQFEIWGAENMEDFSTDLRPWRTINADNLPTWSWDSFDFPHEGDSLGFIVFNPSACGVEHDIVPFEGKKFFASIAAKSEDGSPVSNNDWLISPHIKATANTEFTFLARTYTNQTGLLEKFNVCVSTKGFNPKDFKIISGTSEPIKAPYGVWAQYNFDLSTYKGQDIYVAIQCVSYNNHIFMVDNLCLYGFENVNDVPEFISKPITKVTARRNYVYNIKAEDSNFDELTFKAIKLPDWLILKDNKNGTATLEGKAQDNNVANHNVTIQVADGKSTANQNFIIDVSEFTNKKPEFVSKAITKAKRAMHYNYNIDVKDADNDKLTLTLSKDSPNWLSVSHSGDAGWILSGTPIKTGSYDVSILANDGFEEVKQEFSIVVSEPIFKSPANLVATKVNEEVLLTWENTNSIKINEDFEGEWLPKGWQIRKSKNLDGLFAKPEEQESTWFQIDEKSFGQAMPQIIYSGKKVAGINYTANDFNWLISPEVNVEDGSELSFQLFYVNKTYQNEFRFTNFRVMVIDNEGNRNQVLFLNKDSETNTYDKPVKIDLSNYSNQFIRVAFVYEFTNSRYPLLIDDVVIKNKKTSFVDSDGKHVGYNIYKNDKLLKTINDISILSFVDNKLPETSSIYYVTSLYENPKGESAASNTQKVLSTSVINSNTNKVQIYPNPCDYEFTIKTGDKLNDNILVKIYNSAGKKVYDNIYKNNIINVNINSLTPGVYMLKIINGNNIVNEKLIVK